jgi:hypothetical protein
MKGKLPVGVGADKSLGRTNSRCRKTQSIVSLESGVRSYAELEFLLHMLKGNILGDARYFNNIET